MLCLVLWSVFFVTRCVLDVGLGSLVVPACTSEVEKVCKVSSEEHLQPFKGKMDEFLSQGEQRRTRVHPNMKHTHTFGPHYL